MEEPRHFWLSIEARVHIWFHCLGLDWCQWLVLFFVHTWLQFDWATKYNTLSQWQSTNHTLTQPLAHLRICTILRCRIHQKTKHVDELDFHMPRTTVVGLCLHRWCWFLTSCWFVQSMYCSGGSPTSCMLYLCTARISYCRELWRKVKEMVRCVVRLCC